MAQNQYRAIGLMSGTSLDGVDAAFIETDGESRIATGPFLTIPYEDSERAALRSVLGGKGDVAGAERVVTEAHARAVARLRAEHGIDAVDLIGFHGHTILHDPQAHRTWQIGDGALLAQRTGVDVVCDFRSADVAAGGEGAPFVPLYHAALAAALPKPLVVLNIGGVANVTYIGETEKNLLAFDTGPGNALIDDWALRHTGRALDHDGALAKSGRADVALVEKFLDQPYFDRRPPKSLDRDHFAAFTPAQLSAADGAATLTALTVASIHRAMAHFPAPPKRWLVTGGGRRNPVMMAKLRDGLADVAPVEEAGWNGDALEAQAFAWLAVRSLKGLPLSVPGTTGVPRPMTGGKLFRAA